MQLTTFLPKVDNIKDDVDYYLQVINERSGDYEENEFLYEEIDEIERVRKKLELKYIKLVLRSYY